MDLYEMIGRKKKDKNSAPVEPFTYVCFRMRVSAYLEAHDYKCEGMVDGSCKVIYCKHNYCEQWYSEKYNVDTICLKVDKNV